MTKIQTLHLYLDKEKKNLENLKSTHANRQDILRAEHTIRTLQEQLQLLCVEVNKTTSGRLLEIYSKLILLLMLIEEQSFKVNYSFCVREMLEKYFYSDRETKD